MPTQPLGKLTKVPLRDYWKDEARDLTQWLAEPDNLRLLSNTLEMELELEGTEVNVGPFKADIVANDLFSDSKVVIENQLEKTNHDHLGKILTYASGLNARVMIWVAREFTEEHRRALDFINENAAPELRCYGIEIQLWKIGDSVPAPMFRVISKPNDYTSEIKTTAGGTGEISQVKAIYLDFWIDFVAYCKENKTRLNLRKPRPQHWFSFAIGRNKFSHNLVASLQNRRIGCEIYMRGKNAKTAFHLLYEKRKEIEANLGPLEWMELPAKQDCRIIIRKSDIDISNKVTWPGAFAWLLEQAEKFQKTFPSIIKSLPDLEIVDDEDESNGETEA